MRRPTRQELDQAIVDAAAGLFARHGYSHTSVQQIADAVGYSKTGLLHRFPSKEALRRAVVDQVVAELETLVAAVQEEPLGPGRDLAVVRAIADMALRRRGSTALMLSALTAHETPDDLAWLGGVAQEVFRSFGVDETTGLDRRIRVFGALGAVSVAALATSDLHQDDIRELIVAAGVGALGASAPRRGLTAVADVLAVGAPQAARKGRTPAAGPAKPHRGEGASRLRVVAFPA